ncbi:MAG TPA: helix-hairpin-helix domain-containing protein [Tepidisphaeraceae bacterium]
MSAPPEPARLPETPEPAQYGWTLRQRRGLMVLLSILVLALFWQLAANRRYVPEGEGHGARAGELASRLDPNKADWQELAAIPNLGEKRAKDIVTYRDRVRGSKPGGIVFQGIYDLRAIRGIGPATVERLRPYLIFPGEIPSTVPAQPDEPDATGGP